MKRTKLGSTNMAVAKRIGVDSSVVSRRLDSGKTKMKESRELQRLMKRIRTLIRKVGVKP